MAPERNAPQVGDRWENEQGEPVVIVSVEEHRGYIRYHGPGSSGGSPGVPDGWTVPREDRVRRLCESIAVGMPSYYLARSVLRILDGEDGA